MNDVEHLSKMQLLKSFNLTLSYAQDEKKILSAVHAAGRVPFLERFGLVLTNAKNSYSLFLKQYADLYPEKKLILETFWLVRLLEIYKN